MPNIRVYNAPQADLRPNNAASQVAEGALAKGNATASLGQSIGQGVSNLGQAYEDHMAQQEISRGMPQSGRMSEDTAVKWKTTVNQSDPNDPSVAPKFQEEAYKQWDDWVDTFQTKKGKAWAQEQAEQSKRQIFNYTTTEQASRTGLAAVMNHDDYMRSLSNVATIHPEQLPFLLSEAKANIETLVKSHTNLDPDLAEKMRTQLWEQDQRTLGLAAGKSMARANPDAAMDALTKGQLTDVLDAGDRDSLYGFAQEQKRAAVADQRAQEADQRRQQKEVFDQTLSGYYAKMFRPDGSVVVPKDFHGDLAVIAGMPQADPSAIHALGDAAAAATEDALTHRFQTTNQSTYRDFAGRIGLPPTDPNTLTHSMVDNARAKGQLSNTDWQFFHQAVESKSSDPASNLALSQINHTLERVKPMIDHSNLYQGKLDPSGSVKYDQLYYDVYQRYNALVKAGKSPAEASDILMDPRNPNGIESMIPLYQTNNKQGLQNIQRMTAPEGQATIPGAPRNPNAPAARKPGESTVDYLKRVGG